MVLRRIAKEVPQPAGSKFGGAELQFQVGEFRSTIRECLVRLLGIPRRPGHGVADGIAIDFDPAVGSPDARLDKCPVQAGMANRDTDSGVYIRIDQLHIVRNARGRSGRQSRL